MSKFAVASRYHGVSLSARARALRVPVRSNFVLSHHSHLARVTLIRSLLPALSSVSCTAYSQRGESLSLP